MKLAGKIQAEEEAVFWRFEASYLAMINPAVHHHCTVKQTLAFKLVSGAFLLLCANLGCRVITVMQSIQVVKINANVESHSLPKAAYTVNLLALQMSLLGLFLAGSVFLMSLALQKLASMNTPGLNLFKMIGRSFHPSVFTLYVAPPEESETFTPAFPAMPSLDQVLGSLQEAVTVTLYDDDEMDKPPEIVRVPLPDNAFNLPVRKATVPDFSDEPEYPVQEPYAHNVVEYLQLKWNLITDEEQAHLVTDLEYWNGRHAAILPRIKLQRLDIQEHLEHIWNYFQPLGNYACEIMELVLFNLDEYPPSGVGAGERLAVLELAADEFKNCLTDSKCARKLKDDKYAMGQIVKWLDSERSRNSQSLYNWMFPSLDTLLSLLDWVEKRLVGSAACDSRESITVDETLEDEEGAADVPDLPSINEADPLLGQKISTLSKVKGLHGRLSQIIIATIPAKIDIPSKAVSAGDWMKNAHQRYNSRRYEEDPDNTKGVRTWAMELLSNSAMNRGNEAVEANLSNLGYNEYDVAGIGKVPAILIMLQTWKTGSRVTLNAARFIGILSHPDSLQDAIGAMGIWMFDRFV
ncbi:hypothetical protein BCR33DRAFT_764080 [Rhizoclosmatium globosum]|uniref:Uncharacterized protein n=1 Tax=Rhizoclosmatium globosum TaxID=329046 RepID=A0A1Y2CLD5_9FUNG|nr:hypothetical protein BCR33DRAFT_764080 [Rhizoclosmatium globosum]|eukprot:ORY47674.1 hypothetical protein BCR33DRAFT_764080 [Rhizoclosmatium globosum]